MSVRLRTITPVCILLTLLTSSVAQAPRPLIQTDPANVVNSLAFSADGSVVATGSSDRTVRLWDVRTGQQVRMFTMEADVNAVALSLDRKRLAGGDGGGTIKLWDADTGEALRVIAEGNVGISSLAFSPDGELLASAAGHPFYDWGNSTVTLWDTRTGNRVSVLEGHSAPVVSVAFSPDGRTLASGSRDRTIKLWDVAAGRELKTLVGHTDIINAVAFSRDGRMLASGGGHQITDKEQTIKLWDVKAGVELRTLRGHEQGVLAVSLSPDAKFLVSGGFDQTVNVWEVETGRLLRSWPRQSYYVRAVAVGGDGEVMAAAVGPLKLWNLRSGEQLPLRTKPAAHILWVSYSSDGKKLICAGASSLKVWDTVTGQMVATYPGGSYAALSHDGRRLVGGSPATDIRVWDAVTGEPLPAPKPGSTYNARMASSSFAPDGHTFAAAGGDSYAGAEGWAVRVWDAATGREVRALRGHTGPVRAVVFSPDGRTVASGSWDKTVKLWDVASGKERLTLKGHTNGVNAVAFSPDGATLVSGGFDKEIRRWDSHIGLETGTFKGHAGTVNALAFSPDGKLLASGSADKAIKLWDVATGRLLRTLEGHSSEVNSVAFSPDGKILVSGSSDASAKLWDVAEGKELASLITVGLYDGWEGQDGLQAGSQRKTSGWLVVTPDGLFDGDAEAIQQVSWRLEGYDEVAPLSAFYNDFYHPGLLAEIMEGGRPAAVLDVAFWLQLPGLRAMLSQGLVRIERRVGKNWLCSGEKPTARAESREDGLTLFGDLNDWEFHEDDAACMWRKELPDVRQARAAAISYDNRKSPLRLPYDGVKSDVALSTLHVLTVGVGAYDFKASGFRPLPSSVSGAREVERKFRDLGANSTGLFRRVRVWDGLYDASATRDGIRRRLSEIARSAEPQDVIFLYFSGHGLVPAGQELFNFATIDMRGTASPVQHTGGLDTAMLADAIREMPARRIVLIIDSCQSGGAIESLAKIGEVKALAERRLAGSVKGRAANGHGLGVGVCIIAASTPLQEAVQSRENSALGITLLEALAAGKGEGKKVWVSDLIKYVRRHLPQVSKRAGLGHTPMTVSIGVDFPIFAAR